MLTISNKAFSSRLFTGTGKFRSADTMFNAIKASESELVTLAMKRIHKGNKPDEALERLRKLSINLLPNTSGATTAKEAVYAARLAQAALDTNWIKLEIHPDQRYLLPDPVETLIAAEQLVKEGFVVLPYCGADPVLCKRLEEVGCAAVMPLAAPIGSNRGLLTKEFLHIIIEQATVPVIVDAGIGKPSEAMAAMEMGVDAVLINTAIATAFDPVNMAAVFAQSIKTGRQAFEAGLAKTITTSSASSPLTQFLGKSACV